MIISDLSYLEVVSEVPSIVGGILRSRTNEIKAKAKANNTNIGSDNSIASSQSINIISSNDDL
jgi:hypothetical protein